MGYGTRGDKLPDAKATDGGGERGGKKINGVAIGMEDATGRSNGGKERGEYNTGRTESTVYRHKKEGY